MDPDPDFLTKINLEQTAKKRLPGLVNIQKANWKMTIEIVDLPINSMVDLSIVFCMFTRGYMY